MQFFSETKHRISKEFKSTTISFSYQKVHGLPQKYLQDAKEGIYSLNFFTLTVPSVVYFIYQSRLWYKFEPTLAVEESYSDYTLEVEEFYYGITFL